MEVSVTRKIIEPLCIKVPNRLEATLRSRLIAIVSHYPLIERGTVVAYADGNQKKYLPAIVKKKKKTKGNLRSACEPIVS